MVAWLFFCGAMGQLFLGNGVALTPTGIAMAVAAGYILGQPIAALANREDRRAWSYVGRRLEVLLERQMKDEAYLGKRARRDKAA